MKHDDAYQEALQKIKEAQRTGATRLSLNGMGLTTLPPEIGQLTALTELRLYNNQLSTLPPEIGQLTALRELLLHNNQLSTLPPEIVQLTALTELRLDNNQLSTLPPEIGQLTALTRLDLDKNQLSTLPPEIVQLTALTELNLNNNQLSMLPREIGQLTALTRLYLDNNQLSTLPESLRRLTKLEKLFLHANPALGLPPEILGPTWEEVLVKDAQPAAPQPILDFYFRLQEDSQPGVSGPDTFPLNEAKILVVGEPGVGKTALIHWITEGKRLEHPEWTPGIEIGDWTVASASEGGQPIRVNIWDFGGQEIMQATHQFFLTERSLYLLVIDSRENEEQSKLRYWMEKIRTFGVDSPVIVVLNKRDEGSYEPDDTRLRKDYPENLPDPFCKTVCDGKDVSRHGEGIEVLRQAIIERVRNLDNVRQKVPGSYLKAKTALEHEAGKRKNLPREEYDTLCEKHKLTAGDRNALLAYLKQLGTLLHYDSPGGYGPLPDTYVLDPTWVTQGVYAILTDLVVRERHGQLELADLKRIFHRQKDYPKKHQMFILAMMEADLFELCFPIPDPPPNKAGLRLIPELLPPQEPDHGIEPGSSLNLEYHYDYLPAGLIPRFIVRMHNAISKNTYWKNGVVMRIDGRRVLVRGSREEKKVFVSVEKREPASRRALTVVRHNLAAIHGAMRHLEVREMVSLPDDPGVTVDYKDLEQYEKDEGRMYSWRPQGAKRKYTVRELLEGIEEYTIPKEREIKMEEKPLLVPQGKVFISYAWEDKGFAAKVRQLADDLRTWGVDAWIDQYMGEMGPAEGWPAWMDKIIREASTVLMVCSPKYLCRVKKEEKPGTGLGATWEGHLIYQHLYDAQTVSDKFRAVLFEEDHSACIPTPVKTFTHFKMYQAEGFEELYRALTGQHRVVAPPLGTPRVMPTT